MWKARNMKQKFPPLSTSRRFFATIGTLGLRKQLELDIAADGAAVLRDFKDAPISDLEVVVRFLDRLLLLLLFVLQHSYARTANLFAAAIVK